MKKKKKKKKKEKKKEIPFLAQFEDNIYLEVNASEIS